MLHYQNTHHLQSQSLVGFELKLHYNFHVTENHFTINVSKLSYYFHLEIVIHGKCVLKNEKCNVCLHQFPPVPGGV